MAHAIITYIDGRSERVDNTTRPGHMIRLERRFPDATSNPDIGLTYEATVYLAWLAAGRPGDDFDAWMDTLDDVRMTWSDDAEPATNGATPPDPPTTPAAAPRRRSRTPSPG